MQIIITEADQDAYNFICDAWVRTYRKARNERGFPPTAGIPSEIYFPNQRELIYKALERSKALVAKNETDDSQLFGFLIYEETPVGICYHYTYVKKIFRQLGIGKRLMEDAPKSDVSFHSHTTKNWKHLIPENCFYNPYIFMKGA